MITYNYLHGSSGNIRYPLDIWRGIRIAVIIILFLINLLLKPEVSKK